MKIAIISHKLRGIEIIQILESLGGKNVHGCWGDIEGAYYFIDSANNIDWTPDRKMLGYKYYTLEEFEKEFPFKIGDKVIDYEGDTAVITGFAYIEEKLGYSLQYENGRGTATSRILKLYKEMKEKRNITLTLDKAKEWYKKGGELKEVALQAFTEKELNPLPKSWEEYCRKYVTGCLSTRYTNIPLKYDALIKLEQLRDCWRQGNIPQKSKYKIRRFTNTHTIVYGPEDSFLSFCDFQTTEEFLECFRDLIKKAGDLI